MDFGDLVLKYMKDKDPEKYADENCPDCKGEGTITNVACKSYDICFCVEKAVADELIDKFIDEYRSYYGRS